VRWIAQRKWLCALALTAMLAACAQPSRTLAPTAESLAQALARQPVVLLGEVHDSVVQHALRVQALRLLVQRGARPAFAFEQFDRDRQPALDRARADRSGDIGARVDRLIAAAGERGWQWDLYRPYLALALEQDLPIVAANLSHDQAMRIAQEGLGAVFDKSQRAELELEQIDPELQRLQEREIEAGHCGKVPREALPDMARAQIARDALLAESILPYREGGVVLLTGNGHARRDIGVVRHLPAKVREKTVAVGLLEDDERVDALTRAFDYVLVTPVQARPDPCASLGTMHGRPPAVSSPAPAQ